MFQSIKRLTKHSVIYGFGHILSRSLGFLLLPIHTNVLPPDQYGNVALLFSALAILNIVFTYGMDVAFLRFYILEESKEGKQRIFSTVFFMIFITGICFSALMILCPHPFSNLIFRSAQFGNLIRLSGGILLTDAVCLIPFLVLRGEERSAQFVFLKSLNIAATLGFNVLFVVILREGVPGVFISNLLASLFTLGTLLPIFLKWLRPKFSKQTLSELLMFGLPYIPSGLSVIIMDQIGRFFLDRMIGKEATGIFSASYKLGMIMALLVAAFRFAWHPFFLSTLKEKNAPQIFARILTYFILVTGFFFLGISFFVLEIIHFRIFGFSIIGEGFESGAPIVPIVMLAYIGYGVYVNFLIGIYLKKKTAYLPMVTGIGALVSILSNFLLIPISGVMGAAWSALFAYISMAAALFVVSKRLYFVPYEYSRIAKLVFLFGGYFFLGTHLLGGGNPLYRILLLISVFPLLWLLRFFHGDEKSILYKFFRPNQSGTIQ